MKNNVGIPTESIQADRCIVEFLIQGYDNPMCVATYKTAEDVRKVLPTEEELRRIMDEEG